MNLIDLMPTMNMLNRIQAPLMQSYCDWAGEVNNVSQRLIDLIIDEQANPDQRRTEIGKKLLSIQLEMEKLRVALFMAGVPVEYVDDINKTIRVLSSFIDREILSYLRVS